MLAVPQELLEQLAAEAPADSPPPGPNGRALPPAAANGERRRRLKVEDWLRDRGVPYRVKPRPDAHGRTVYVLARCPFDEAHADPDACIMQGPDGKTAAHCFHNGCAGRGWQDFKRAIGKPGPEHYDPPFTGAGRGAAVEGPPAAAGSRTGRQIILEHLMKRLVPSHKRGTAVYSTAVDDWVKPADARYYGGEELIQLLGKASDRPRAKSEEEERDLLPAFCNRWRPDAWSDMLRLLSVEEEGAEIHQGPRERFRRWVGAALYHPRTFALGKDKVQECRTLLRWCETFARPGNWGEVTAGQDQQVRSLPLWCRRDELGRLRIALRVELFELTGPPQLRELSRAQFTARCKRYDVSCEDAARPCGAWAVELDPDFIAELQQGPPGWRVDGASSRAHTREGDGAASTEGQNAETATT